MSSFKITTNCGIHCIFVVPNASFFWYSIQCEGKTCSFAILIKRWLMQIANAYGFCIG
jgi:hypothetical protein